ncbi:hypothetical protein [Solirubrobacter soli]|uniref:hypothetical protein n=1 Tax=Solirubrobacter soli TaxID=363832 RepID=UPI0003FCE928|nr:hypothetical protein [Solirubrobacter soli]
MTATELPTTLQHLLQANADSNPAFDALLHDYAKYHAVLAVLGGLVTSGLVLLTVRAWRRSRALAVASAALGLLTALIVFANAGNALNPRHGLEGTIPMLRATQPGTEPARVQQATNAWLRSGSADEPRLLQDKIDARLSWQRPKAIITSVLFAAFVGLCIRVRRRRIVTAVALLCTLALLVMAVANTQASFAPMFLTVLYG